MNLSKLRAEFQILELILDVICILWLIHGTSGDPKQVEHDIYDIVPYFYCSNG